MAIINKAYVSDAVLAHVECKLSKTASGQFFADTQIAFDGGRKVVAKRINLAVLTQAQRDAGLLFFNAVHAASLALVTEDDL